MGVNERGTASRPATEQGKLSAAASEGLDTSSNAHGRQYRCKLFCICAFFPKAMLCQKDSIQASIAQLAEHLPRKQKVSSSNLDGGCTGRWSRGMILASGARGRGFDSRTAPLHIFSF